MKIKVNFYYDLISPYCYFFLKSRKVLEDRLELIPAPIFLPRLFRLQNNRGPAEVPEKRAHTYQFCVWKAQQLKVPFRFPPRYPFASAAAQRLLLLHSADMALLDKAFDFVWAQGHDPELEWPSFCETIGLPANTPKPAGEEIKKSLSELTEKAAQEGVFGVPSIKVNQHVFWGLDTIDWILQYLDKPGMFDEPEYQNAMLTINPLLEKR